MKNKIYVSVLNTDGNFSLLPKYLQNHAVSEQSKRAWGLLIQKYEEVFNEKLPTVSFEKSGKPVINGGFISISHSKNIVGVAFSKTAVVGIDVELIRKEVPYHLKDFLGEKEPNNFYIKWTRREAVIKAKNYSALKKGAENEFFGVSEIIEDKENAFSLSVYGENAEFIKV